MNDPIRAAAARRHALHANHASSRPLSAGYELIGLRGEEALCREFGGSVDLTDRPRGDGGKDKIMNLWGWVRGVQRAASFAVDVKTARRAYNLIVEHGKITDPNMIYVLGAYIEPADRVVLLGWEWGDIMRQQPVKDFGYGVINHFKPRAELQSLDRLKRRLVR